MSAAEAHLETLRSELLGSNSQVTMLQARLHQEQIEGEKSSYRREHNDVELERLAEQARTVAGLLAEGEARAAELQSSLETADRARQEAIEALRAMLEEEAEAGAERDALRERLGALRQRAEVLDQLAADDEERRHRLQEALARAGVPDPSFLADRLQVPDGFEHTIDLYLEAFRDAVLVPLDTEPLAIARALERDGARAELLYALRPHLARSGAPSAELEPPERPEAVGFDGQGFTSCGWDDTAAATARHDEDGAGQPVGRWGQRAAITALPVIGVAPPSDPAVIGGLGESLQLPPEYA
jgi:chromosome segregation ATPase